MTVALCVLAINLVNQETRKQVLHTPLYVTIAKIFSWVILIISFPVSIFFCIKVSITLT